MPRPLKVDRPFNKTLSLPSSLCAKVDMLLYSEVEGRVPHGAWAALVESLLLRWIDEVDEAAERITKLEADDGKLQIR